MFDPRHHAAIVRWAGKFFEGGTYGKSDWALGIIDDDGNLRGAIIGLERNDWTAEVTIASDKGISFSIAREFFRAFFAKYNRMELRTTKDNKTIKRNAVKWGGTFEGTARGYYGRNRDALCFRMLRSECRWLRENHGKQAKPAKADRSERRRASARDAEHQERKPAGPV